MRTNFHSLSAARTGLADLLPGRVCLLSWALALLPLTAQSQALYLSGAEASPHANYLYLGRLASFAQGPLQNGPAYRLWLDQSQYRYYSEGRLFEGRAVGIEAAVGQLFGGEPFSGSAFVSLVGRDTRISPHDTGNRSQGFHTSVKLSTDLNYRLRPDLRLQLGASYTALDRGYWSRARLLWNMSGPRHLGLEQVWHGDRNYGISQTGLVLTGLRWGAVDTSLKLGSRHLRGDSSAVYLGIELGWLY